MLGKLVRLVRLALLSGALCGLCASAHANTTMPGAGVASALVTVTPSGAVLSGAGTAPDGATRIKPIPAPGVAAVPSVRIALVLPLRSEVLEAAAKAVRAGFLAAYERDKDGISVTVLETGEGAQDVVSAYVDAQAKNDIVVGPLARGDVAAVAQSGAVAKPTIVLTQPERTTETVSLPASMLVIGLSVEDEARQAAVWAGAGKKTAKAFVVSTNVAWQKRAAHAFSVQWQSLGLEPQEIELAMQGGYFSASGLAQLAARIQEEKPPVLFAALDAEQVRQMRALIGNDTVIYGTSQLNAVALADRSVAEPQLEMNGVRFFDIPWQLQADHLAVMSYPQQAAPPNQKRSADLERLYALGIDAYRIAREVAAKRTQFDIDGVTGALSIHLGKGAAAFKRVEQAAQYQNGIVAPARATPKSAR